MLFQIDFVLLLIIISLVNIFCLFLFRQQPRWGAANIPYSRWLPPEYEDVWGAPRGWDAEHTYNNASLPPVRVLQQHSVVHSPADCSNSHHPSLTVVQVRLVSQEVLFTHNDNISLDSTLSHLLVEWGQWIDHDVVLTPQSPSTTAFKTGADCTHTCSRDTPCFPIQVLKLSADSLIVIVLFLPIMKLSFKHSQYLEKI